VHDQLFRQIVNACHHNELIQRAEKNKSKMRILGVRSNGPPCRMAELERSI
jgi:hypothetical protein